MPLVIDFLAVSAVVSSLGVLTIFALLQSSSSDLGRNLTDEVVRRREALQERLRRIQDKIGQLQSDTFDLLIREGKSGVDNVSICEIEQFAARMRGIQGHLLKLHDPAALVSWFWVGEELDLLMKLRIEADELELAVDRSNRQTYAASLTRNRRDGRSSQHVGAAR
jgi:hypothetical protein